MSRLMWIFRRGRTKLLFLTCALFILLPPAVAYAWTNFIYAQGIISPPASLHTPGFAGREYNRAWHHAGYDWDVYYAEDNGQVDGYVQNTSNPTNWPNPIGYAEAFCENLDDNSGTMDTCQTTKP